MGAQNSKSVYEFTVKDAKKKDVQLSQFKGKVLLIVNVASNCGYTDTNYKEMNQLYEKYKDQGFEILAFPCNQFGAQEPGTDEEIQELACTRFKADYPVFAKIDVKGPNQAPLYRSLKSSSSKLFRESIKWNFTKFLIDREGNIVGRYKPETTPLTFEDDIKKLIGVAAAQTDE